MASTLLTTFCLAFALLVQTQARELQAASSCAAGADFEVYKFDGTHSFHSILNVQDGVASIAACAQLCLDDWRCKCAYYPGGGLCIWREDTCASSELFIDATPVNKPTGLISVCNNKPATSDKPAPSTPVKPVKPATALLKRYATCGGKGYTGARCCKPADHCVQQNVWYAQCLPKNAPIKAGWTGKILTAKSC